jgi:hypothetical protein
MNPAGAFFVGLAVFWLILNVVTRLIEVRPHIC